MKYSKMLGLVAVATVALVATVGVGSASAGPTVLCKENNTECAKAGKTYGEGTVFKASVDKALVFKFELGGGVSYSYTCTTSTMEGEITNPGGAGPVIIGLETFTLANCTCPQTAVLNAPTLAVAYVPGTMNGELTSAGMNVTFNCMGHCRYGDGVIGTLTGGAMGTIDLAGSLKRLEGGVNCPASAKWSGSYTVTAPEPVWVSEK
ncbi:MAG TPA: hypothetical protein VN732_11035 [Solirubrobacterales bacterium]|nr:hypothetical protein [Solirubrobacterales bacterium]